ncbi:hypothetical protein EV127DRAFT_446853 [Xylaria flabelliformis]|nr:hypothetical protein EV127DRAFT_446853 [Xylaria flabelliformis]
MEPEFSRLVRRKKSNGRGYGPSDFEKFDRYSACAGYRQLGEVKVTTSIDFEESQWGLIGTDTPGAIIHMNIGFTQPEDCKLVTATILVTLESLDETRDEGELDALKRQPGLFPLVPSRLGLTHFGPVYVPGREMETDYSRNINATPAFSYGGASLSDMGVSQQKTYKYYNRWMFSGQLLGDDKHSSFKKLQWFLQENKLDAPANHGPEFRAAFALIHDRRSFFIRVEIKGKLEKRRERVKQRFQKLKYGFYGDTPLRSTLTLVNVAGVELPRRQLITKAKNLPGRMAKRNGVVEVASEPEMKEDEEEDDDTASPQRGRETPNKKLSRKAPRNTPEVSEMKKIYASLSASAISQEKSWMSSTTLVEDNSQGDQNDDEDEDENAANSEHESPRKREKNAHDAEDLNFLLIIRLFFHYLFLQAGFAASKDPRGGTTSRALTSSQSSSSVGSVSKAQDYRAHRR